MIEGSNRPGDRLAEMDFAAHNAEVDAMWRAFRARSPYRIPIILGTNTRYFMLDSGANWMGIDFQSYSRSPATMFEAQLEFMRWRKFNLLQDEALGLPDEWAIAPDFQNYYEAAWFGCPVEYRSGEVPDTRPVFADCPERIMDSGLPGPLEGVMGQALEYWQYYQDRAPRETFLGRPIRACAPGAGLGTDGPLTVACNLFGPSFVCTELAADPDRVVRLLQFIAQATIERIGVWRKMVGIPMPNDGCWIADDSLALISSSMYRKYVLPIHCQIYDAIGTRTGRGMHLCGDSTRHFRTMVTELGVSSFDTGFPVDFGALRASLGPEIEIAGGPHVELLRSASPAEVRAEAERILRTGILEGGRFILREGNNLAPGTPLANTEAFYSAGREFGKLKETNS